MYAGVHLSDIPTQREDCIYYPLVEIQETKELDGRLIISFDKKNVDNKFVRQSYLLTENWVEKLNVAEVLAQALDFAKFPSFKSVHISFSQLKTMEENARKFFEESKKIMENDSNELLIPIKIEAEKEIIEATDTINCFIDKLNSAMTYSANAIEQSKNASIKLEEITDEFDKVIDELTNSADFSKQLNKSEDIVIQSQENLMNSTKKLQELKNELDKLMDSCKAK